jgi:hypothetical protein
MLLPRRTAGRRAGRSPEQVTDERAAEPDKPGQGLLSTNQF